MSCLGRARTIYNICRRVNDMQSISSDKNQGKMMRPAFYAVVVLVGAVVVTMGVSRLKSPSPMVDRSAIQIVTVRRGPVTRKVQGLGVLVPEEVRWLAAATEGHVEQVMLRAGARVKPNTVILQLSNPDLDHQLVDGELATKKSEAELANLRVQLESEKLTSADEAGRAQLAAKQAEVAQVRALYALKMQQKEALQVHAGIAGVLEEVTVDAGQQVAPGTNLAKIRSSARLMARLHVPEWQSRDLQLNQKAQIELQDRPYSGHVARIDPGVQNGAVDVDVKVDGAQPAGVRTDLTVDGTIEVERVADAVYLGRVPSAKPNTRVPLFKLVDDGKEAQRVMVELGNTSIDTVEIVAGLQPGDRVIVSDMSTWSKYDRVLVK